MTECGSVDERRWCLALHGYGSDGPGGLSTGDYPQFLAGAVWASAAPAQIQAISAALA